MTAADESAGFVTGSPVNPAATFTQVTLGESVNPDGLTGSPLGLAHMAPISTKSPDISTKTPAHAEEDESASNPSNPSLDWPADAAWAQRWQAKIDGGRYPQDRADAAWRALRSALRKVDLPDAELEEILTTVTAQLIDFTNAAVGRQPVVRRPVATRPPGQHTVLADGSIQASRRCSCEYCLWVFLELE